MNRLKLGESNPTNHSSDPFHTKEPAVSHIDFYEWKHWIEHWWMPVFQELC